MNQSRAARIAQMMQRELGQMLLTEVKDPGIGFVSITRVEVSRDLGLARAYVSIMGSPEQRAKSLKALKRASAYLRGEVARRLGLRRAPELAFQEDVGISESMHIQRIIRSLEHGESHE